MTDEQRMYDELIDQMAGGDHRIRGRIEAIVRKVFESNINAENVALLIWLHKSINTQRAAEIREDARLRDAALAAATVEELPPGEFAGWKIEFGFCRWDLEPGTSSNKYDTPAAAEWYGNALEDAVKAEYPGATVEIREGRSVPQGWIVTPPANTPEALVLQIDIIRNVEEIDERVFDSIPWEDYDVG